MLSYSWTCDRHSERIDSLTLAAKSGIRNAATERFNLTTLLGFLATSLIIYSQILLGWKKRYAFVAMSLGNFLWFYVSIQRSPFQIDLAISSLLFLILSIRNFILWGKK